MSMMMVQVDVMCCKSVGTDLSMMDIDDLMTEICQLKKEVKLLETKLRERDQLNRKDVCGVSLCDFTDQTSPDLLLSVCNEEQKTSVKLLDCEMELKTQITEEQTDEDDVFYSDLMEEESSGFNEIEEKPHHLIIGEESEQNFSPKIRRIATDKQSPSCPQCGKIFNHKSKLSRHMRIHTGERPYTCDQCGKTFISNCHLKRHLKIHIKERSFRCEQCGRTFTRKVHLKDHMRDHTGEKPYRCHLCGMMFFQKSMLQDHMRRHTEEKSHHSSSSINDVCGVSLCDFTDQTSPDLLLSVCNEEQKTSVKLLDCEMELKAQIKEEQTDEDDAIYSNLEVKEECSGLNEIEEKTHHLIIGEKSLGFLNTEQNFTSKNSQITTDKQPPSCPQCGKIFSHKSKLSRHMRIHTGERPYTCDQCGMSFTSNCHLRRHMKIHTGERSYRCDQCGRTFTRNDHLKDHMRLHNGEKSHQCSSCGRSFEDSTRFETHKKKFCQESQVHLRESVRIRRSLRSSKDVCGVSLCDFTDQTSPDLLLSVCNEEQKTSVKLLDCEMELKTQIKEEQTDEDDAIYSNLMEVKEECSEPHEIEEKPHHLITGVESVNCLNTEMNFPQTKSQLTTNKQSPSCPQCGKIFARKSKLNRHIKIHSGERPYTCDQCGMTFTSNFHLQRHMNIHTGERSYKCEQCGRTFTRKDHLKDHMRLHNGEKSHHCSSCGRSFKDSARLETHRKKCYKVYPHETVQIRRSLRFSGKTCKNDL